jgi:hypothetical protein
MTTPNLFGEKRIQIKGDAYLNKIAQHLYDLYQRDNQLAVGDSIGEINRKFTLAIYYDSGLPQVLKSGSQEQFTKWFLNTDKNTKVPTEEEIARAIREMSTENLIPLSKTAIVKAEQYRSRIANNMRRQ